MSDERARWARVQDLFVRALEVPEDAHSTFLAEACPGDPALAAEVAELLQGVEGADRFFGEFRASMSLPVPPAEPEVAGRRVGRYRILGLLGRGGMGAVYLAERDDEQFEKQVALKLLPVGMAGPQDRQRFLRERQVLAGLEHPGIARLLDGGVAEDGTPYFVMEYVRGTPIDRFCDERRLSVGARVDLFLRVCDAVAYAHRNLVIHRDLKPGNILVTDEGDVRLLDFGIARVIAEGAGEQTATWSALTPAYASPEQIRNEPLDTTTDVYSLGALLYRLLSGHPPRRLAPGFGALQLAAAAGAEPPPPPSQAVRHAAAVRAADGEEVSLPPSVMAACRGITVERLVSELRDDLDAIVLMALRPEQARRYPAVAELAADLERWRDSLPVSARRGSRLYRAGRFLRRNRGKVAAAALLSLMLMVITGLSVRDAHRTAEQARVLASERDRARQESVRARSATDLLVSLFESPDPTTVRGDTVSAGTLLRRGAERIRSSPDVDPGLRGELLAAIGTAFLNLGLPREAQPLLHEAVQLEREEREGGSATLGAGLHALARAHQQGRDFAAADTLYRAALAVREALIAANPADSSLVLAAATSQAGWAATLRDLGQVDSAVALARRVIDTRTRYLGPDQRSTLEAVAQLAYVLRGTGEAAEAERLYRAVARRQRALGAPARSGLAQTLNNLAFLLRTRGEHVEAEALYREAWAIQRETLGESHPTTIMVMASNLASVLALQGKLDEAEALLRRRIELESATYPAGDWRIGSAWGALGIFLLRNRRDPPASEPPLREQLRIYRPALGEDNSWTAGARVMLGECLLAQGRPAEAETLLRRGYHSLAGRAGPPGEPALRALGLLASLYERKGDAAEAARYRALLAEAGR